MNFPILQSSFLFPPLFSYLFQVHFILQTFFLVFLIMKRKYMSSCMWFWNEKCNSALIVRRPAKVEVRWKRKDNEYENVSHSHECSNEHILMWILMYDMAWHIHNTCSWAKGRKRIKRKWYRQIWNELCI